MKYTFLAITLFLSTTLLSLPTYAGQSLSEAAESVKQRTGGRILSTKTSQSGGQRVYKIKVLLPSGKVQTFTIDAK